MYPMEYNLKVSQQEFEVIFAYLRKGIYQDVVGVINNLCTQVNAQLQPTPPPPSPPAPTAPEES